MIENGGWEILRDADSHLHVPGQDIQGLQEESRQVFVFLLLQISAGNHVCTHESAERFSQNFSVSVAFPDLFASGIAIPSIDCLISGAILSSHCFFQGRYRTSIHSASLYYFSRKKELRELLKPCRSRMNKYLISRETLVHRSFCPYADILQQSSCQTTQIILY